MSEFKACVDAIRRQGLEEAADLVAGLAAKSPRMFAAVSISENNYGDTINGFDIKTPQVFLTRKSAKQESQRLTCELLRTRPLSEVLEQVDSMGVSLDSNFLSTEITRVLGFGFAFPDSEVDYWSDPRCEEPLLPKTTSDEQALEVAKLLKMKFFKVVSVPCDTNLTTPTEIIDEPKRPFKKAPEDSPEGYLALMNWFRRN